MSGESPHSQQAIEELRAELEAADTRRRACGRRALLRHPVLWASLLLWTACGWNAEVPGFYLKVDLPGLFFLLRGEAFVGAALGLVVGAATAVIVVERGGFARVVSVVSAPVALAFAVVGAFFLGPEEASSSFGLAAGAAALGLVGFAVGGVIEQLLRTTSAACAARLLVASAVWLGLAVGAAWLLGRPDEPMPLNRRGMAMVSFFAAGVPWGLSWLLLGGPHGDLPAKLTYWASLGFEGRPSGSPVAGLFRPRGLWLARRPDAEQQRLLAILSLQDTGGGDPRPLSSSDESAVRRGFDGVAAVWLLGMVIALLPYAAPEVWRALVG